MHEPVLNAKALNTFLAGAFPLVSLAARGEVMHVERQRVVMAMHPGVEQLRPGGLVSGPTLMAYADVAAYAVLLAHIGEVEMAVTSTLTINFLRACKPGPLSVEAVLLKLGRRAAIADIRMSSAERLVAQATVGYALP